MKKSQLRNIIREVIREQSDLDIPQDVVDMPLSKPKAKGSCHPNARKIGSINCDFGTVASFGCLTVDNYQVPQVGQVIYGFSTNATTGNPVFYKITSIDPQDPFTLGNFDASLDPNGVGCGYDCDTTFNCVWNSTGNAQYSTWNTCNTNCSPANQCTNFSGGICGECMFTSIPTSQQLTWQAIHYNLPSSHLTWDMLANPGRSWGAWYHKEWPMPGGCECCHDPQSYPNPPGQSGNTPPPDWNQPWNPPMTPVCLEPTDPQYNVGYPCDCWTNNNCP